MLYLPKSAVGNHPADCPETFVSVYLRLWIERIASRGCFISLKDNRSFVSRQENLDGFLVLLSVAAFAGSETVRGYGSYSSNNLGFSEFCHNCWERKIGPRLYSLGCLLQKNSELRVVLGDWGCLLQLCFLEDHVSGLHSANYFWYLSYLGHLSHLRCVRVILGCLTLTGCIRLLCSSVIHRLSQGVERCQFGTKTLQRIYLGHERKRQSLSIVSEEGEQWCSRKELVKSCLVYKSNQPVEEGCHRSDG